MANVQPLNIRKVEINGYDFLNAFTAIVVYEDIFKGTISGYIDIMETEGGRESIPIIGEEILRLEFASRKTLSKESDELIKLQLRISGLTNFHESNTRQKRYRLSFQSLTHIENRTQRIRKAYNGTSTDIASTILKKMFEGREFVTLDPAKYSEKVVFPNWNPFKCINYLAQISVSEKYNDPYYIFYEDRDGYHFTTFSQLFDKNKVADIKTALVLSISDPQQDEYLVSEIHFSPMFDTWDNEARGMYGGTLISYDKVTKEFKEVSKTYSGTYEEFKHIGKRKLTVAHDESSKNSFQFVMTNQDKSPGVYTRSDEWATKGILRAVGATSIRATIMLNRATDLKIGDLLEWNFTNVQNNKAVSDKFLSGKWLITRMKHIILENEYKCQLEIIKDSFG